MASKESKMDETVTWTRRRVVTALAAGAVTLTATHLGVAYESAQWEQQQRQPEIDELKSEVEKLKGLIALYENLDKIGIDAVISGAMTVFRGLLEGLRGSVGLLRGGVGAAEGTISGFQSSFAVLRGALTAAEQGVDNVVALLKNVQDFLGQTTSPVEPLIQQVRQFFSDLLGKIPFGVGDNIRQTVDGVTGLVIAVPSMVLTVKTGFLEPLRATWFSDDNAKNVQGALLDPINQTVLQPLAKFLDDVDQMLAHWESDVATPVQAALDQRDTTRKQIVDYKSQHNLS
jgi:hypothetical protein